jgi:8-oxo-dGTP pyrophosphatase MutT (NUDIX family)
MSIKTISTRVAYSNRWMTVREDVIQRTDGSRGIYSVVEKPDFALVIPIEEEHLYLVEQYRFPVGARYLEFPQGSWERNPSADPITVARGELQEETGLCAGRMDYVGHLFVAYGMSSQGFHVFRATQLIQGKPNPENEEQDLVVKRVPVAVFEQLVRSGGIKDAASVSAWALLAMRRGELSGAG